MPSRLNIYLIRHGESEANLDKAVNLRVADHQVALSDKGHQQASEAGTLLPGFIQELRSAGGKVAAYVSPYRRTRETWSSIQLGMRSTTTGKILADEVTATESIHLRELEFG